VPAGMKEVAWMGQFDPIGGRDLGNLGKIVELSNSGPWERTDREDAWPADLHALDAPRSHPLRWPAPSWVGAMESLSRSPVALLFPWYI